MAGSSTANLVVALRSTSLAASGLTEKMTIPGAHRVARTRLLEGAGFASYEGRAISSALVWSRWAELELRKERVDGTRE